MNRTAVGKNHNLMQKILNEGTRTLRSRNQLKEISNDRKKCLLLERKSATPKTKDLIVKRTTESKEEKNHIKGNIDLIKSIKFSEKPHKKQDTIFGHCQDSSQAGLELRYVFKKEYGKTPPYIKRNRYLIEKMKKIEQDSNKVLEPSMRYVEDEEKDAVLDGLRQNLKEVEKKFLSLPIVTDTLSKRNRKMYLENLLLKLQQDIETLEKHDIIVLND